MARSKNTDSKKEKEVVAASDANFSDRCRMLGENLRYERRKRGFSIQDVAAYINLSTSYVGLLERGVRSPSLKNFFNLCDLFSTTPNELMLPREKTRSLSVAEKGYKSSARDHFEAVQSLLKNLDDRELEFVASVLKGLKAMKSS